MRRRSALAALIVLVLAAAAASAQDPPRSERVSVGFRGQPANGWSGAGPDAVSRNGRFVVFGSQATNLVRRDRDDDDTTDVFLRDTRTDRTKRLARRGSRPAISAKGRVVAYYASRASCNRLVVLNRRTGERRLVPMARRDTREPSLNAWDWRLSPDGRYVVSVTARVGFGGNCADQGPEVDDENFALELFDRRTGRVRTIGTPGLNLSPFTELAVSRGGRMVVLAEAGPDLVAIDTRSGRRTLVGVDSEERSGGPKDSWGPDITPDGRYVAFTSTAALTPDDVGEPNPLDDQDVFVRDLRGGTTTLASPGRNTSQSNYTRMTSISADGRTVAFAGRDPSDGLLRLYVRDLRTARTRLVTSDAMLAYPWLVDLALDGSALAFELPTGAPVDPNGENVQEIHLARLR